MSNCINNCKLCRNLVISTSVTVVTVGGTNTLVVDIPSGFYPNCGKVCLVVAQTIPETATITMPVAISIGGDTTTVYPIVGCDCNQITACGIRTRTKYALRIVTNATSAVFRSLNPLPCYPTQRLQAIPTTTTTATASVFARNVDIPVGTTTTKQTTTVTTTTKKEIN